MIPSSLFFYWSLWAQSLSASVLLQPGVLSVHAPVEADESSRWIISVQEIVEADVQFNEPEVDGNNLHNESWCSRSHCGFHDFYFDAVSDVRRFPPHAVRKRDERQLCSE